MSNWERVTALYGAARELEPAARGAFLTAACANDREMLAEVERLLDDELRTDGFLRSPLVGESFPPALSASVQLQPGETLSNRYRIEAPLGSGGQAFVYVATDTTLSRRVVIKVMRGRTGLNTAMKWRFEQEKRALARIDHPGVVGILDVGTLPDGAPFLVIQYIDGESLRDRLRGGPLQPVRVAEIVRDLGSAIGATHAAGVAHQDLKPENIMLQRTADGGEQVKVIDFGIAKVDRMDLELGDTAVVVAGTVRYMAPEQFEGRNIPASDIYALALVTCEMLCGKPDPRALPRGTRASVRKALDAGVRYDAADRPSDVRIWAEALAADLLRRHSSGRRLALMAAVMVAAVAVLAAGGRWAANSWSDLPRVVEKVGAFDPRSEGFRTHNDVHGTVAETPARDGYEGWIVTSPRQGYYVTDLTARQKRLALDRGWMLSAVMRVDEGTAYVVVDFADYGRRYDIVLYRDGPNDLVRLQTQIAPQYQGLDTTIPHDGQYRHYELRYDPGLQTADLWIDGVRRLVGYRGNNQFQGDADLFFGSAVYRSNRGIGVFKLVRFEIIP